MGRTYTPTFRVNVTTDNPTVRVDAFGWTVKHQGRPTDDALAVWVAKYNESFAAGGCNEQISKTFGQTSIVAAEIVRQSTDEIVASYALDIPGAIAIAKSRLAELEG